eukprot:CAMPEP_0114054724 /NCGR_PEP_ID=MMETSP1339-20121228/87471_1 /TAXON_ID=94617 /ORGANISM="Fibrocapsa japonica" /LENGTH=41 /assembly_acc=CAM_ASM_000762
MYRVLTGLVLVPDVGSAPAGVLGDVHVDAVAGRALFPDAAA